MDFSNKRILVVVAHPDDEVLGCGASLNKLITEQKCFVRVVILGEGLTARDAIRDSAKRSRELSHHRECIESARKNIGYQELSIHQFADNRFDSVDLLDLIKVVEKEKKEFKPDWIFTHHGGDLNIDHRRTFEAVLTASRPLPDEKVEGVLCFETFSSSEWSFSLDTNGFRPNVFISFDKTNLSAKLEAMKEYKFETRDFPHPRSIEALEFFARASGAKVGQQYAENFLLVRMCF
jgi:LmbE family N-acetylglucosaminyl deacetylase